MLTKMLAVYMGESNPSSTYKLWLSACIQASLSGADPLIQIYVAERGLVECLVKDIILIGCQTRNSTTSTYRDNIDAGIGINDDLSGATYGCNALQVLCDLLASVIKFNPYCVAVLDCVLKRCENDARRHFKRALTLNILQCNVLYRSLALTFEFILQIHQIHCRLADGHFNSVSKHTTGKPYKVMHSGSTGDITTNSEHGAVLPCWLYFHFSRKVSRSVNSIDDNCNAAIAGCSASGVCTGAASGVCTGAASGTHTCGDTLAAGMSAGCGVDTGSGLTVPFTDNIEHLSDLLQQHICLPDAHRRTQAVREHHRSKRVLLNRKRSRTSGEVYRSSRWGIYTTPVHFALQNGQEVSDQHQQQNNSGSKHFRDTADTSEHHARNRTHRACASSTAVLLHQQQNYLPTAVRLPRGYRPEMTGQCLELLYQSGTDLTDPRINSSFNKYYCGPLVLSNRTYCKIKRRRNQKITQKFVNTGNTPHTCTGTGTGIPAADAGKPVCGPWRFVHKTPVVVDLKKHKDTANGTTSTHMQGRCTGTGSMRSTKWGCMKTEVLTTSFMYKLLREDEVALLAKLITAVPYSSVNLDNVSVLNTAMVILLLACLDGRLPALLTKLKRKLDSLEKRCLQLLSPNCVPDEVTTGMTTGTFLTADYYACDSSAYPGDHRRSASCPVIRRASADQAIESTSMQSDGQPTLFEYLHPTPRMNRPLGRNAVTYPCRSISADYTDTHTACIPNTYNHSDCEDCTGNSTTGTQKSMITATTTASSRTTSEQAITVPQQDKIEQPAECNDNRTQGVLRSTLLYETLRKLFETESIPLSAAERGECPCWLYNLERLLVFWNIHYSTQHKPRRLLELSYQIPSRYLLQLIDILTGTPSSTSSLYHSYRMF
eukprot:Lankesteria_metandrocarpae@DN4489_c0_g1_i1.p1